MMTPVITSYKLIINTFDSLGTWWDDLKGVIRQNCINFSIRKRKQTNANRTSLTTRLILAKQAVHSGDLDATSRVRDLESAHSQSSPLSTMSLLSPQCCVDIIVFGL